MNFSSADLWLLITVGVLAFLVAGALAPLEALGWWAGWFSEVEPTEESTPKERSTSHAQHFLVFLAGIDSVSGESYTPREVDFIRQLRERLPETEIVELYPYSLTNRPLTAQRTSARVWRWVLARRLDGRAVIGFMINLRNVWQVVVSADRRYGPLYNEGSAELILRGLEQRGYVWESGVPITLLGYSGGVQIACGAASPLHALIGAPLEAISLGGVMSSDPGLSSVQHLYHLYGERDGVQRLGALFFPGRWPFLTNSEWNRAKAQDKITFIPLGPSKHTGAQGYMDADSCLSDGRSYLEGTLETIVGIVRAPSEQLPKDEETVTHL